MSSNLLVSALTLSLAVSFAPLPSEAEPAPIAQRQESYPLDTGSIDNPGSQVVKEFDHTIVLDPAIPWIRVFFSEAHLDGASEVRVTSLSDGSSQVHDAASLAAWENSTGYASGSSVRIELFAGPFTTGNRLVITELTVGMQPSDDGGGGGEVICGSNDDRVPSTDVRVGRILPQGCTGWISDVDCTNGVGKCHLSAGHCAVASGFDVIQFGQLQSQTECGANPSMEMDRQFKIRKNTIVYRAGNGLSGGDFAVFCTEKTNGMTSDEKQGDTFTLAASVPSTGAIRVTGYGRDRTGTTMSGTNACGPGDCISGMLDKSQQRDDGTINALVGTGITYNDVDTCDGNSGSPVILISSDEAIGVHEGATGQTCPTDSNKATQITAPLLQQALQSHKAVPALSQRGAIVLGLLLLTAMFVTIRGRGVST